jgi:hypothetical protein
MDPAFEPFVTDELKSDPVAWPILEKMPEKSVTDVLKGYAHSQHRLGSALPMLNGDAKPEDVAKWKEQHLPKLQKAGLVPAPVAVPEKYEIKLPEGIPPEAWSEADTALAQEFGKKHGLSQEALNDGLNIALGVIGKYAQGVQVDREKQKAAVQEWAKTENIPIENVISALDRWNKDPRGWDTETAEAVSKAGYADNPLVVKAIYKLMTDSGILDTRDDQGSNTSTPIDDQLKEFQIGGSKWEKLAAGDKATMAERDALYAKKYPGKVSLS